MIHDLNQLKTKIKPKATSTLNNMRKADLIKYIRDIEYSYNSFISSLKNSEEMVRCEDGHTGCFFWESTEDIKIDPDGFCSYGERFENERI